MRKIFLSLAAVAGLVQAQNAVQVSSYFFQNNLNSQRAGSQPLLGVNPSGRSGFVTDLVFGERRTVYDIQGAANGRVNQGGFTYDAKDKVPRDSFSIEFVFAIRENGGDRPLLDFSNRTFTTNDLHLNRDNFLRWGRINPSTGKIDANTYYHVIYVKAPSTITVYLNGTQVLTANRPDGDMSRQYNPDQLVHFLLDGTNISEWAPARVALFRVYSGNLTAAEARTLAGAPFTASVGVPPPRLLSSGIVNSATNLATIPGGFFTLYGTELSGQTGDWSQAFVNGVAPKRLNDTRVLINDQEAFMVFTHPTQINAIAPDNLLDGPVNVVLENGGVRSAPVQTTYRRVNPGVFRFNPQDSRYVAATANDGSAYIAPPDLFASNGSLNGLAVRGARPGEYVVIYGNGLGPTNPPVPAGQIPAERAGGYPLAGAAEVRLTASGGQVTTVVPVYAGLSGFPGLSQIVFQIPDVPNGDYQLVLAVAGQTSPNGAFLPISR